MKRRGKSLKLHRCKTLCMAMSKNTFSFRSSIRGLLNRSKTFSRPRYRVRDGMEVVRVICNYKGSNPRRGSKSFVGSIRMQNMKTVMISFRGLFTCHLLLSMISKRVTSTYKNSKMIMTKYRISKAEIPFHLRRPVSVLRLVSAATFKTNT